MGIEVLWDNEAKTIIRYIYAPDWTWQDFEQAAETSTSMAGTVTHSVGIIADFSQGAPPPMGALAKFKRAQETAPPNLSGIAIVGGGVFINTLVNAFSRVYRRLGENLIVTGSLDDARTRLSDRLSD